MKKYSVSVDFVAFGDLDDDTTKKLEAFHAAVDKAGSSHIQIIPPSPNLLSDSLLGTPIIGGEGAGAGEGGDEFGAGGIDAAADPELAYVLRLSLEEENQRVERERKEQEAKEKQAQAAAQEAIPEEGGESQQDKGESSGSKDDKGGDSGDKMDTA